MKHRTFRERLAEDLKHPHFKKAFESEDLPARLALKIAMLRQKRRMTQTALAHKLGTKQQLISRIESLKHTNITLETLQEIARALHCRLVVDLR